MLEDARLGVGGAWAAATALTGAAYAGAQWLAEQRVAWDARFVADAAAAQRRPPPPPPPARRLCAALAADGVVSVQVYWPATLVPGEYTEVHGWCLDGGPGEVVVVVIGVRPRDAARVLPGVRCVGTCAAAPARVRRARDVDLHMRPGPALAWVHLAAPVSAACRTCVVVYAPPDAWRLEALALDVGGARARAPTRLEQLVAMDPDRRRELCGARRPGAGLRCAVRCIALVRWAWRVPRSRGVPAVRAWGAPRWTPCALYNCAAYVVYGVSAWPAYVAWWPCLAAAIAAGDAAQVARAVAEGRERAARAWDAALRLGVDLALGWALAAWLERDAARVGAALARVVDGVSAPAVCAVLDALASWPLGIKLNTELAQFLRDVLASVSEGMTRVVHARVRAHLGAYVAVCAAVGRVLGVSGVLSVQLDALAVVSAHLALVYAVLRRVYGWVVCAACSLFDLFRGRKRNPLHGGRVDAAHYEVDQLFLGTILFTLLVFLAPTVGLFYAASAAAWVAVQGVRAALAAGVGVLAALPLYALGVGCVCPARAAARLDGAGCGAAWAVRGVPARGAAARVGLAVRPLVRVPALVWAAVRGAALHVAPVYPT
ncbi:pig-Q [Malassezia brasiliensis]|uniref:Pig-Q n=1 Tax=Malassezia brasiliensis TaxID=1821822 RepID=A0AAF0IQ43_9BASI|nr:pig-Q [Malassezia brasiliensis]